eukprot:TRINITY_DN17_c0_g2_i1.p1 TRINITY_DN17_c0_g2~~TRINITY_DN17_c0_g2_i1.p1  ORF type:complete len:412 (+),score=76.42 TRINITY_DN17_c0_g2_i1:42-1277(+)
MEPLTAETDKGGYIAPRFNCPHSEVAPLPIVTAAMALDQLCSVCDTKIENWLCLTCHNISCSRYVHGHMSQHNATTSHHVAISLSDLNTWCYGCDCYVTSKTIVDAYKALHLSKFGSLPGDNLKIEKLKGGDQWDEVEKEESEESAIAKAKVVANRLKNSNKCVIFTGAGISTSAKIPDFRGPEGVWTLKAKGLQADSIKLESAVPTYCHMAIVSLQNHFKEQQRSCYVISQNIDGLHRRSGIPSNLISELHGNSFKEICWSCNKDYLRTFDTAVGSGIKGQGCKECISRVPKFCHCTPRKCTCGQQLKDSIIHFGERLPVDELKRATDHAQSADFCLVLGSSLTVSPANELPQMIKENGGTLCIVNLQTTRYDSKSDIRVFAKTDFFLQAVMKELNIPVQQFDLSSFFNE